MAGGIGAAVLLGVWVAMHLEQLRAALHGSTPQQAVLELLGKNGDLVMLASAAAALPSFGAVVLCRRLLDRKPMLELGLAWRPRHLLLGLVAGAAAVLGLFGVLVAMGHLRVTGLSSGGAWKVVGLFPLVFLQSGTEEFVCRGYLLRTLMSFCRPLYAVAAVSLFFGALHLLNPDATLMSFAQTTLIGVLFAEVCLRTGGLWVAIGLHTAWNFTLGTVASLPVSGLRMSHLLEVADVGNGWMTGGGYGLEASVLNLALVVAACGVFALLPPRQSA